VAAGAVKTVEELRAESVAAEKFAAWAQSADDDEAPALLFYPKPAGQGKGVWSWKQKAKEDARLLAAALVVAEAAAAAASAAAPAAPAEPVEEDDGPRYVAPAEAAEVTAARLARWAAEGRSPTGVLLNQGPQSPVRQHNPYRCECSDCVAWRGFNKSQPELLRLQPEAGYWLQRPKPHTPTECAAMVKLWGEQLGADLILYDNCGWDLDDLYGVEMQTAHEQWVAACHAVESFMRAAEDARIAAAWRRACVDQAKVEARRCLKKGQEVQKNGRICTRCYSCEGNKHTDWEDGGKKARPSTLHVSSECFMHAEFLAGRERDDCPFLHTGDAGWHAEWDTNFLWDPLHPEVVPVPKHIRKREGDAKLCITEKSAGYLPLHLGGKVDGMDAREWRSSAAAAAAAAPAPQRAFAERAVPEGRFAALGGGSVPSARGAAAGGGSAPSAAGGGGARRSGPGSAWARK
jgi:hypothetical protein